jgi:aconitate hydratase
MMTSTPSFIQQLTSPNGKALSYCALENFSRNTGHELTKLPYSLRLLMENTLRQGNLAEAELVAAWQPRLSARQAIHLLPSRVLLQDLTGVPVIADLAAFRAAAARQGHLKPGEINPVIPVDLVIDHSIQADSAGSADSMAVNAALDLARNHERYQFLDWAKRSFKNLRVFPSGMGIVHQMNVEYLSTGVITRETEGVDWVFPEMVIGTDSHTTMVNGLGIVGWGVGGIEAISAMLGESIEVILPEVIGVKLTGTLSSNVTATDLALHLTELLRKRGVVDTFVEFTGSGLESLPVTDRITLSNMSPENGATMTFFPTDQLTL